MPGTSGAASLVDLRYSTLIAPTSAGASGDSNPKVPAFGNATVGDIGSNPEIGFGLSPPEAPTRYIVKSPFHVTDCPALIAMQRSAAASGNIHAMVREAVAPVRSSNVLQPLTGPAGAASAASTALPPSPAPPSEPPLEPPSPGAPLVPAPLVPLVPLVPPLDELEHPAPVAPAAIVMAMAPPVRTTLSTRTPIDTIARPMASHRSEMHLGWVMCRRPPCASPRCSDPT